MAHWTQVSVLSHLHLQQAKEIKSQSNEIRHLSTLLEKQQAILEKVQEQQRRMPEIPIPPTDRIEELQREAFNILPGTVNARRGAALAHASGISSRLSWLLADQTLKMSWPRKPHGLCTTICKTGALHFQPSGRIYIYPQRTS